MESLVFSQTGSNENKDVSDLGNSGILYKPLENGLVSDLGKEAFIGRVDEAVEAEYFLEETRTKVGMKFSRHSDLTFHWTQRIFEAYTNQVPWEGLQVS